MGKIQESGTRDPAYPSWVGEVGTVAALNGQAWERMGRYSIDIL